MLVPVLLVSTAIFAAMVMNMALKPSFVAKITTTVMLLMAALGLYIYGAGYYEATGDFFISVIRTPFAVTRMFVGVNDLSSISESRFVSTRLGLIAFYLVHLMAFYCTASAVMVTIGTQTLRKLRLLLSRRGRLVLIYGINPESIELGRQCRAEGNRSVVYVTRKTDEATIDTLAKLGMSVLTGPEAAEPDAGFVRKLRIARRKLTVFALDQNRDENLFYAMRLKDALQSGGAAPENTQITLPGTDDITARMLQVTPEKYGFGYVNVFDTATLAARRMVSVCPPWDTVSFDENGRARENFECIVIGFSRYGQAALKQLVINGQYAGSSFKAAIFDPAFDSRSGYLRSDCPELMKNYSITAFAFDGRSKEFYDYLEHNLTALKYVAVCTGDEALNSEISDSLLLFFKRRRAEHIRVVQCGRSGVRYQQSIGAPVVSKGIYTLDMLSAERADRKAIIINNNYDRSNASPWEKWVNCDSFSKLSSRASAAFLPAILRASGYTARELESGEVNFGDELLENLGETEHLRWNAFHFTMGYTKMTAEEFDERAKITLEARERGEPCDIKLTKNADKRTHACLISWDELDELSEKVLAVTGREKDFKQLDKNNVLAVPELLKADRKAGELK